MLAVDANVLVRHTGARPGNLPPRSICCWLTKAWHCRTPMWWPLRWRSFAPSRRWGFSDCLVLEIARKAGHQPLATFDKALGRLAGAQRL